MILVVDDHLESRNILVRLLKKEGLHASAAGCGIVALDIMRRQRCSLLILDCHMPEFDGFMMLEKLQGEPHLADVPVVMFSAGSEADVERALRLGARHFIRKGSLDWGKFLEVVMTFTPIQGGATQTT